MVACERPDKNDNTCGSPSESMRAVEKIQRVPSLVGLARVSVQAGSARNSRSHDFSETWDEPQGHRVRPIRWATWGVADRIRLRPRLIRSCRLPGPCVANDLTRS